MLYCLMCQDKENAIETRMQNREDHLKYVSETNVVKYAGPFLSEEDTRFYLAEVILAIDNLACFRERHAFFQIKIIFY